MPYRANYPATVAEVLDASATFNPAALQALKAFARSKPWRGTLRQRRRKFRRLNRALASAYGIARPLLVFHPRGGHSSYYRPAAHRIVMVGRLSVVTFLHEFGHARGFDERQACRWSLNLFRRCFPLSFAACRQVAHTLVRVNLARPEDGLGVSH